MICLVLPLLIGFGIDCVLGDPHSLPHPAFHGCPGSMMKQFHREQTAPAAAAVPMQSQLAQWPCQIKLVPVNAPYFDGAKLLIAADCSR